MGTPLSVAYLLWPLLVWQIWRYLDLLGFQGVMASLYDVVFQAPILGAVWWLEAFMLNPRPQGLPQVRQSLGATWMGLGIWRSPILAALSADMTPLYNERSVPCAAVAPCQVSLYHF